MRLMLRSLLVPSLMLCGTLFGGIGRSHAADMKRLLVVSTTSGFRHSSIATLEKVLLQMGMRSHAFTVDFVRQPTEAPGETQEKKVAALKAVLQKLSPASLADYDGVVFANTTGDLPIPDRAGFLAWIASGKAFIGIHSASDTFHDWPEYREMLGAEFATHGDQVGVDCRVVDKEHLATKKLWPQWSIAQEEIYQFKNYKGDTSHELLVLDKHPNNGTPGHFPLAWTREYGTGKVFYTALGHREDLIDDEEKIGNRRNSIATSETYQNHLLGGILWALGVEGISSPK